MEPLECVCIVGRNELFPLGDVISCCFLRMRHFETLREPEHQLVAKELF